MATNIPPYFVEAIMAIYPQVAYVTDWVNAWDADNNPVQYDSALVDIKADEMAAQAAIAECKVQAMSLLASTDWVNQPDVRDPANSPHLTNAAEFDAYRLAVRQYAVYPVTDPVWPTLPTEQWSA